VDFLIESIPGATHFLLRNITMILGDIKSGAAIEAIGNLMNHPQNIVRMEAVRSLAKIGSEKVGPLFLKAISESLPEEVKKMALDFLTHAKDPKLEDRLVALLRQAGQPDTWRRHMITALGSVGGKRGKEYFESVVGGSSMFDRFNSSQREELNLIKSLLPRMKD